MNYLLDTHILLWALAGEESDKKLLPDIAAKIINNHDNTIYYSSISIFEIEIKRITKPDLKLPSGESVIAFCKEAGYEMIPLYDTHSLLMKTLKKEECGKDHKDPYDWLLISQANSEGMKFITSDNKLKHYLEDCIMYVQ